VIIIVSGAPGSGKTTISYLLAQQLGLGLLASGKILRKAYESGNTFGKQAHRYWYRGDLVPVSLVHKIILPYLRRLDFRKGFVADGYPLRWEDWLLFEKVLIEMEAAVDWFVALEVPRDVCLARISDRSFREDDADGALLKRFDAFEENHRPLSSFFERQGKLLQVSGLGTPQSVVDKVVDAFCVL